MIITCQNCQTHYSLDTNALGGGKTVRCSNCGNTWHQNPVQPAMAAAPAMAAPQQPFYAEQAPHPQPAAYPAPPPPPPPMPEPPPPPMPEPEPAPMPEPEPEAMPEPMPEPDAIPEPETAEDAEPDTDESASPASESGAIDDALSPEQLDEMFGEETESDAAFQSLGDDAADDEEGEAVDPEDIPDPEPIPQVFSADDDDEDAAAAPGETKGGKGKIIAIAAVVVFLLLGAGLFFGKGFIVGMWPGAADVYAMIGLGGDEVGAGLAIRNIKSAHEEDGGVEVLVVRGVVANVSEEDRPVPMIRVTLMDATDNEVQYVDAAPLKNRLPPGATIGFKAQISQPSALARRVVVTFSEGEKAGG